jgi:hypothetical protein
MFFEIALRLLVVGGAGYAIWRFYRYSEFGE